MECVSQICVRAKARNKIRDAAEGALVVRSQFSAKNNELSGADCGDERISDNRSRLIPKFAPVQLGSQVQADVSDVGSETSRELRIAAVDRHQANDRRQQDVIDDLSIEVSSVRRNVDGVCSWRRWNRREQRDLL